MVCLAYIYVIRCQVVNNLRLVVVFQVYNPNFASFAKVTPTSHNGSVELVKLQKKVLEDSSSKVWIEFQKVFF